MELQLYAQRLLYLQETHSKDLNHMNEKADVTSGNFVTFTSTFATL